MTEYFFEQDAGSDAFDPKLDPLHEEHAKEICAACNVRLQCLEWAITAREPDGIWGGMTPKERRRAIRRRRRAELS
jgi:hypothetical protein